MSSHGMLGPREGACGGATVPVAKEVWQSDVPAAKVKVSGLGGSVLLVPCQKKGVALGSGYR